MRYYIIAGEKSGDIYGSRLTKALQQLDSQAIFRGYGGNHMQQAGVDIVVHYRELAVMGVGFLRSFIKLYKYYKNCKKDIEQFQPDAIILIDYAGFNLRIAKFAKEKHIKVFYYISPKLWAWNTKRVHKIKAYVDQMFTIFPFEKDFYKQHNYHTVEYVGNPLIEEAKYYNKNCNFLKDNKLDKRPIIALLPGSRLQEITKLLPVMLALVTALPEYQFVVAGISELPAELYMPAKQLQNITIIYDQIQDILSHASVAVVTSGTATLETAYFNVAQVVVYKTDPLTYNLAKWLVKLRYISLVNILAKEEVVRELIQEKLTPTSLLNAMKEVITNSDFKQKQLASYESIRNLLGENDTSINTAKLILKHLSKI
ncbi:MAG: lipid-A-disaccharide synthase [Candidatus Amoebophilus sp.]